MSLYKGQVSPLKTFPSTSIECAWFLPPTPMHQKIIWFCRWCSSHHNYFWNTAWDNFFWRYSPFQERSCHQDHVFKIISVIIGALMSDNLMKKKNWREPPFFPFFVCASALAYLERYINFYLLTIKKISVSKTQRCRLKWSWLKNTFTLCQNFTPRQEGVKCCHIF